MIKKVLSLLNLPNLKTVAMAIIAIVAAFFTGRLIGWGEGKDIARQKQQIRNQKIATKGKKIDGKVSRLKRNQLVKRMRAPRNRK